MSHRWFRLETIKVTLIVVFHTPSLQVSRCWQIFLNMHLLSADEKALSSCIKHKKRQKKYLLTTTKMKEVTRAGATVRVASLHL